MTEANTQSAVYRLYSQAPIFTHLDALSPRPERLGRDEEVTNVTMDNVPSGRGLPSPLNTPDHKFRRPSSQYFSFLQATRCSKPTALPLNPTRFY